MLVRLNNVKKKNKNNLEDKKIGFRCQTLETKKRIA